ncbi:MAG: pseudaminic acid synthase, partial [Alphaproteobacteria bacterium]|nr:pseudaminic acid synthase [Alphaproteobacteria bacterium]
HDIAAGQPVTLDDVEFRRPGFGIGPDLFDEQLCDRKTTRAIAKGAVLELGDFAFD